MCNKYISTSKFDGHQLARCHRVETIGLRLDGCCYGENKAKDKKGSAIL